MSGIRSKWGWTAGFGAEWAIWSNWSIKWEMLYARFERDTQTFICIAECDQPFPFRVEFFDSVWTTKLGLNYRFNWGG
jgi:outer membrane immunogenic protein